MRKILGIIFVVLAILGGIADVKILLKGSNTGPTRPTGRAAYDAGKKSGQMFAMASPLIFGGLAWWLLAGGRAPASPAARTPRRLSPENRKTIVLVASIAGGVAGLAILGIVGLVVLGRFGGNRRSSPPIPRGSQTGTMPPQSASGSIPSADAPTQIGAFKVGSEVEAHWGGGWTAGKVTSITRGGFSLFVQLEDARFPKPILLSTNQIRLKP